MIPEHKRAAVERAFTEAFGVATADELQPLAGGLSTALVLRAVVRGRPYLLRVILRTEAYWDPTKQIACIERAAQAGIAPALRYASVADRVLITDYVEPRPYPADAAPTLARTIATLHALPGWPPGPDYFAAMDAGVRRFRASGLLATGAFDDAFASWDEIVRAWPRGELVASHNDLKPQNILFDGTRFQIVDWEAAFRNDRYLDLAYSATFFAERDEAAYLAAYFGEPAGPERLARLWLMRQAIHVAWAAVALPGAVGAGASLAAPARSWDEIHAAVNSDLRALDPAQAKADYALAHLRRASENARSPRLPEALASLNGSSR